MSFYSRVGWFFFKLLILVFQRKKTYSLTKIYTTKTNVRIQSECDWASFKSIRNQCGNSLRKAKGDYSLKALENGGNYLVPYYVHRAISINTPFQSLRSDNDKALLFKEFVCNQTEIDEF